MLRSRSFTGLLLAVQSGLPALAASPRVFPGPGVRLRMVTAKHGNALNDIELLAGFTAAQSGPLDAASPPRAGIEGRFAGRGSLKAGRVACPAPHDLGFWLGEVDHRGRLRAARARAAPQEPTG